MLAMFNIIDVWIRLRTTLDLPSWGSNPNISTGWGIIHTPFSRCSEHKSSLLRFPRYTLDKCYRRLQRLCLIRHSQNLNAILDSVGSLTHEERLGNGFNCWLDSTHAVIIYIYIIIVFDLLYMVKFWVVVFFLYNYLQQNIIVSCSKIT